MPRLKMCMASSLNIIGMEDLDSRNEGIGEIVLHFVVFSWTDLGTVSTNHVTFCLVRVTLYQVPCKRITPKYNHD